MFFCSSLCLTLLFNCAVLCLSHLAFLHLLFLLPCPVQPLFLSYYPCSSPLSQPFPVIHYPAVLSQQISLHSLLSSLPLSYHSPLLSSLPILPCYTLPCRTLPTNISSLSPLFPCPAVLYSTRVSYQALLLLPPPLSPSGQSYEPPTRIYEQIFAELWVPSPLLSFNRTMLTEFDLLCSPRHVGATHTYRLTEIQEHRLRE